MAGPAAQHLTVYLLRESSPPPRRVLRNLSSTDRYEARGDDWEGELRILRPMGKEPEWLSFLRPVTLPAIPGHRNRSTSAALLVRTAGRTFALTFGHGRHLLKPGSYELDFGLRVALNSISPTRVRSLDARTFEEQTVRTRRQVARGTSVDVFGIDVQRDLVNAVTGEPLDPTLGKQIAGRDAVALDKRLAAADLGPLCALLLAKAEASTYEESFSWVNNIRAVREEPDTEALDLELVSRLRTGTAERAAVTPPEIIDWAATQGFLYSWDAAGSEPHALDLSEVLQAVAPNPSVSDARILSRLRDRTASAVQADQRVATWSIYECLTAEIRAGAERYVLDSGQWFKVNDDYVTEIESFVKSLRSRDLPLPSWPQHLKEGAYNLRAGKDPRFAVLDKKLIRVRGRSPVEACDLYTDDQAFIHVKRYSGSGTLSHLFAQGAVSAELFVSEPEFREVLRRRLSKAPRRFRGAIPANVASTRHYGVVYGIALDAGNLATKLPFFSQVSLRQANQRIAGLGLQVHLNRIDLV